MVRPRTGSSSEEDRRKRASVPLISSQPKKSSSNGSLNTIDLSTPASRSRNSSFHSLDSRNSKDHTATDENIKAPAILSFTAIVHLKFLTQASQMIGFL